MRTGYLSEARHFSKDVAWRHVELSFEIASSGIESVTAIYGNQVTCTDYSGGLRLLSLSETQSLAF